MEQLPKLTVQHRSVGDASLVTLRGTIDRDFELAQFIEGLRRVVIFDMDGVSRITSFGIRQWVSALRELDVDYYGFINCPPVVTAQFNMVREFGGKGVLISFYAPYLCENCDNEQSFLVDLRTDYHIIQSEPGDIACSNCNDVMEFDEVADSYFAHARSRPQPRLPKAARQLLEGGPQESTANSQQPFKMSKEISGGVTALWMKGRLDNKRYFKRLADGLQGDVLVILQEISFADQETLQALLNFVRARNELTAMARVPLWLAQAMAADGQELWPAHMRLVSLMIPATCTADGMKGVYEFPLLRPGSPAQNVQHWPRCSGCSKPLTPDSGAKLLRNAAFVLDGEHKEIREYLDRYSQAPEDRDAPEEAFKPGSNRLVLGKYRVVEEIGKGGMGQVFLAERKGPAGFEKKVVLKKIRHDRQANERQVELFLQEARLAARLNNPHIVEIYDLGLVGSEYIIAMEYVDGVDLSSLIRGGESQRGLWPVEICCRLIANLCAALSAAHEHRDQEGNWQPIIHRDVSPHNVMVSFKGDVKLTDFGIATTKKGGEEGQGFFTGKLPYASPEQVQFGDSAASERTDIYSAAAVLYECLTMRRLVPRSNKRKMIAQIMLQEAPLLSYSRSDIPPLLEEVFQKALAKDPEQRYASAHEFELALEEVLLSMGKPVGPRQIADWVARQHAVAQAIKQTQTNENTVLEQNNDSSEVPSLPQVSATQSNVDLEMPTQVEQVFDNGHMDPTKVSSIK